MRLRSFLQNEMDSYFMRVSHRGVRKSQEIYRCTTLIKSHFRCDICTLNFLGKKTASCAIALSFHGYIWSREISGLQKRDVWFHRDLHVDALNGEATGRCMVKVAKTWNRQFVPLTEKRMIGRPSVLIKNWRREAPTPEPHFSAWSISSSATTPEARKRHWDFVILDSLYIHADTEVTQQTGLVEMNFRT